MRRLWLVLALGLLPLPASAIDLTQLVLDVDVTVDSVSMGGVVGDDEAHAVVVEPGGDIVVAGFLTAAADHGTDAWIARFDPFGAEVWSTTVDSGAIDGVTRLLSDDRFTDLVIDANGDFYVSGSLSGSAADTWASSLHTASFDGAGAQRWANNFSDGAGSPHQAGHAVCFLPTSNQVLSAGWSYRSDVYKGRWVGRKHHAATGFVAGGPYGHDIHDAQNPGLAFAPDQIWDVVSDASDNVFVVGTLVKGGTSELDRDYDWHLRAYDSTMALLWEADWAGLAGLDDVPRAVALDSLGHVVVAGYTNAGSDNGSQSDYDWRVAKYNGFTGNLMWDRLWDGGGDDFLHALVLDANDNLIVAGSSDGRWRLAQLSGTDGTEIHAMQWPIDGAILSVALANGQLAVAGYTDDGVQRDARLLALDGDADGDGTGDHADLCPNDANKIEPGECGCGKKDADTDGDGVLDCFDACPDLAEKWESPGVCGCDEVDRDRDGDGTEDCIDNCPDDPNKTELGICGCGLPDEDADGDGVMGCDDACSNTPPGTPVNEFGCPTGEDPGDTDGDNVGGGGGGAGCACDSAPSPAGGLLALAALVAVMRRRR